MKRYVKFLLPVLLLGVAYLCLPSQAPGEDEAFSFAVFSDNQPVKEGDPQPEIFKAILKDMSGERPAFAVSVGDSIAGTTSMEKLEKQFKEYRSTVQSIYDGKVYQTIGNHEVGWNRKREEFFKKELGPLYYSFDRGPAHFIVLDSYLVGEECRIAGEQLAWLKKDLAESPAEFKFVFLHAPLFPVDGQMGKSMDKFPVERDALHKLFAENRVTVVFSGHEHLFNQSTKDGVRYIICGGGSNLIFPSFFGTGGFNHYLLVNVNTGKVKIKVIKPGFNGKSREEQTL
jgi:hypothetical protein